MLQKSQLILITDFNGVYGWGFDPFFGSECIGKRNVSIKFFFFQVMAIWNINRKWESYQFKNVWKGTFCINIEMVQLLRGFHCKFALNRIFWPFYNILYSLKWRLWPHIPIVPSMVWNRLTKFWCILEMILFWTWN